MSTVQRTFIAAIAGGVIGLLVALLVGALTDTLDESTPGLVAVVGVSAVVAAIIAMQVQAEEHDSEAD